MRFGFWSNPRVKEEFFFEKKNQKTFGNWGWVPVGTWRFTIGMWAALACLFVQAS
jgi:hypothetical protein